jgi:hypothetical protein
MLLEQSKIRIHHPIAGVPPPLFEIGRTISLGPLQGNRWGFPGEAPGPLEPAAVRPG